MEVEGGWRRHKDFYGDTRITPALNKMKSDSKTQGERGAVRRALFTDPSVEEVTVTLNYTGLPLFPFLVNEIIFRQN